MMGRRLAFSASVITLVLGIAAAANGQPSQGSPPATDQTATPKKSEKVEKVVVTGTRVKKPGLVSPNPITSISAESIQTSGEVNITNIVERYPALIGSLDPKSTTNVGFVGISGLNQGKFSR